MHSNLCTSRPYSSLLSASHAGHNFLHRSAAGLRMEAGSIAPLVPQRRFSFLFRLLDSHHSSMEAGGIAPLFPRNRKTI
ncbi:unnamed protein product [Urochloa humidicola]